MPEPNIKGRDIIIVDLGVPSETEPAPTILPRSPLNFVIDDCEGFTWFNGAETMIDHERGLLVEGWTDPGLGNKNRTLTIYALSPSCRRHAKIAQFFYYNSPDTPKPNVRGKDIRLVRDHGEDHPYPEVLPRFPLHLVIDDCEGMKGLFQVDDSSHDTQNGIVMLSWADPGVGGESRSLTILYLTQSCQRFFTQDPRYLY